MFRRGVDFLLKNQVVEPDGNWGSWKSVHTQSNRPSDFAATMWAVIGLAGSYGTESKGALRVAREQGEKATPPNLEIVLDVSGSMNTKLGEKTRWETALDVLKEVVDTLPDDRSVGLRVYGHRYPSKAAQTCQDTELVVPIGKIDRAALLEAASKLHPKGETPLIRSVLKSVDDLRAAGGGSVILITDGEESCKGDAKTAASEIRRSGVNVSLNIVGFTLTGKAVENELSALAGSTGGRYYGAQDGAQLSRALKLASLEHFPYEVLDSAGQLVASDQTSEIDRELAPGSYRIRVHALEQTLEAPVTVVADQTTSLAIGVDGDQFSIKR
jgi:Ca-activated chloride channel family protein